MLKVGKDTNLFEGIEFLEPLVNRAPYWVWRGGIIPRGFGAYAENKPINRVELRQSLLQHGLFCMAVPTICRRFAGLEVPHIGNEEYDGGIQAGFGGIHGPGYFDDVARPFNAAIAAKWARETQSGVLLGTPYRGVPVELNGHTAIVLPSTYLLQSNFGEGLHWSRTVFDEVAYWSNNRGVMVHPKDWIETREGLADWAKDLERPNLPYRPPPGNFAELNVRHLAVISENPDPKYYDLAGDLAALKPAMARAGITSRRQIAAFLANVCQETDHLKTLEEYGDRAYFQSFLGAEWDYHGRGYLMNTWKQQYQELSRKYGVDLVRNPDLLAERKPLAARAAADYWKDNKIGAYADARDFESVCSLINRGEAEPRGPINGWDARLYFHARALDHLPQNITVGEDGRA